MTLHKGYVIHASGGIVNDPYNTIRFSDDEQTITYHPWSCSYCRVLNPKEQISYCLSCGAPHVVINELIPESIFGGDFY